MKISKLIFISLAFLVLFSNCKNDNNSENQSVNNNTYKNNTIIEPLNLNADLKLEHPQKPKCGDIVKISFKIKDSIKVDSINLIHNNKKILTDSNDIDYSLNTKNFKTGKQTIKVIAYSDKRQKVFEKKFTLLSDIKPEKKSYKIINTYPHDNQAYTQGLYFEDGILYEATGLENKSSLRKVDIKTGEVIKSIISPNNVFGEGITIFNDKIYQVTWRDYIAYVYDKENFNLISEFSLNTEGWGLTNDEDYLYLSDGTHYLHKIEPASFTVIEKIEVYDNESKIMYLNELEYINGLIYANVYTSDVIIAVDPNSGKVMQKIDLSGILNQKFYTPNTDVLNGIAYDKKNNRIFVTGKNWPKLFEIKIK